MAKGIATINSQGDWLQDPSLVLESKEFSEAQESWNIHGILTLLDGSTRCGHDFGAINDPEADRGAVPHLPRGRVRLPPGRLSAP